VAVWVIFDDERPAPVEPGEGRVEQFVEGPAAVVTGDFLVWLPPPAFDRVGLRLGNGIARGRVQPSLRDSFIV
jgi:hypothetical protein